MLLHISWWLFSDSLLSLPSIVVFGSRGALRRLRSCPATARHTVALQGCKTSIDFMLLLMLFLVETSIEGVLKIIIGSFLHYLSIL